jgi:hypothetical protein
LLRHIQNSIFKDKVFFVIILKKGDGIVTPAAWRTLGEMPSNIKATGVAFYYLLIPSSM